MNLFLMLEPITHCLISKEPLKAVQVDMTFYLEDENISYDIELLYAPSSGHYYMDMNDFQNFLLEDAISPPDILRVRIDEEPVELYVSNAEGQGMAFQEMVNQVMAQENAPPPDPEEVKRAPLSSAIWEVAWQSSGWLSEEDEYSVGYTYIVLDNREGFIRQTLVSSGKASAEEVKDLLARAVAQPMLGIPAERPKLIYINDEALAQALQKPLEALNMAVAFADTPAANHALQEFNSMMGSDEMRQAFFVHYSEGQIRRYFKAAKTLFAQKPWERFKATKFLAFRFDDGPWHYANVMGQDDEVYGLALFKDWFQACLLIHNQPDQYNMFSFINPEDSLIKSLEACGSLENLSLAERLELHPEDASYLEELGIKSLKGDLYPLPQHTSLEGLLKPSFELDDYSLLMEGLSDILTKRHAKKITSIKQHRFAVKERQLSLRYPADGTENISSYQSYQLDFEEMLDIPEDQEAEKFCFEAPGDSSLFQLAQAIEGQRAGSIHSPFYVTGFSQNFDEDEDDDEDMDNDDIGVSNNAFLKLLGDVHIPQEEDKAAIGRGALTEIMNLFNFQDDLIYWWQSVNNGQYGPHLRLEQLKDKPLYLITSMGDYKVTFKPLTREVMSVKQLS